MADSRLSFGQSILTSLSGLILVFAVLAVLAAATLVIAKILDKITLSDAGKTARSPADTPPPASTPAPSAASVMAPEETDPTGEVVAALHGALSMASGIPIDQMAIVSITSRPAD